MGSVNTLVRQPDGSLLGDNTDWVGFSDMVKASGVAPKGKKALVLGSGGASATVCYVLRELGAQVVVISRTGENNYANLFRHKDARLLVNTTPVGMFPNTGVSPVDLDQLPELEAVLDVVYNPARTQLLLDAEARGIPCRNGLLMLVGQAKRASELFTGKTLPDELVPKITGQMRFQRENLVLIGMPGCGKTTIGKRLSQRLCRTFVDTDQLVEQAAGLSIPEIFSRFGEERFRQEETRVLAQVGQQSGLVIATGGGCVARPENYPLLHQNGSIFFLQRDIRLLSREGRPLSQGSDLSAMYQARLPLYQRFADACISNDRDADSVAGTIEEAAYEISRS